MKQIKTLAKQHTCYYLTGAVILLAMKLFAKGADADTLRFLLAPVSFGVSLISGVPFLWEPHAGYISHDLRFLIAASCSGMNFMIITVGMLFFSFLHRVSSHKYLRMLWLPICMALAYCHTILTNTVRILIAIYLPLYLEKQSLLPALLSPETLHTLIGTVVYFTSLLLLYPTVDKGLPSLIPFFWYVGMIWGLPFLTRLLRGNFAGFGTYTLIVLGSCLVIFVIKTLLHLPFLNYRRTNYY